ncbi:hypothetical protein O6P43_004736 [Quillaja saponaria]|uniref:Secreted protein n=1 Tax=Quillaja saponaria TaxID=32244 RepID=A0AAD7Q4G0_QUISA|nr:hypothetical protein O6P43_004736 [Quillaja saponaria]
MKLGLVLKMVICFFLLNQCHHTYTARTRVSGVKGLENEQQVNGQVQLPGWLYEDYSVTRRRQPVHNKLDP